MESMHADCFYKGCVLQVMTDNGILMNNALANFAIPSSTEADMSTENQLVEGRRPLSYNVLALSMDTADICGKRVITGGATPSSVGEVRRKIRFFFLRVLTFA